MKNIADKLKVGFKVAGDATKKYLTKAAITTGVFALGAGAAYNADAQTVDYTVLPGMDPYSNFNAASTRAYGDGDVNSDGTVNFVDAQAVYMGTKNDYADVNGDGVVNANDGKIIEDLVSGKIDNLPGHWNVLNRTGKIDWLNKMKAIDKTDEISYQAGKFECGQFSNLTATNMGGVEDLEIWPNYVTFDGKPITNGRFNIPVYRVATRTQGTIVNGVETIVGGHWINAAFVGPENASEKKDPTKFNQWYFFEPQNDSEVKPGDFSMNKDEFANIIWFGKFQDNITKEWYVSDDIYMINFKLENGIGITDSDWLGTGFRPDILRESPHDATIKFEAVGDQVLNAYNGETAKTPTLQTNLEHYTPTIKSVEGEKEYTIGPEYPEYFSFIQKFMADVQMGRWNASKLSNLGDTLETRITYADRTKPTVVAPADVQAGYNADMGVERMGIATITDDSPHALQAWYEDKEISNNGNYKVIERTHFGEDVSGNIGSAKQKITLDLNTGIKELNAGKSFDLDQNYPNPVMNITTIPYFSNSEVQFVLFDSQGKTIKEFKTEPGFSEEYEIQINMTGMKTGTYFLSGTSNNKTDKISILKKWFSNSLSGL